MVLLTDDRLPIEQHVPRAAYVHVPFCRHRCGYCDFTLVARRDDLIEPYLQALERELRTTAGEFELDTLFFGGGTPTHLAPDQFRRLCALLRDRFVLAAGAEWSVEANPSDIDAERAAVLQDAGVTRVSLGAQAFDDRTLVLLERDHSRETVRQAIELCQAAGMAVSIDLIFAVPGQSPADWNVCLAEAVRLPVEHVSTYCLTFEKGTSFWKRKERGQLSQHDDDIEREMYASARKLLPESGRQQYEISSFAMPGLRCRHNQGYWSGQPYLAFGPGAASYVDGVRRTNHRSVTTWLKRVEQCGTAVAEEECLPADDRARTLLVLGLRVMDGINRDAFRRATGNDPIALGGEELQRHVAQGNLVIDAEGIRLTDEGVYHADAIAVDLL